MSNAFTIKGELFLHSTGAPTKYWAVRKHEDKDVFWLVQEGDYLSVSSPSGELAFEGVVVEDNSISWHPINGNPYAGGQTINGNQFNWIQCGMKPEAWSEMFEGNFSASLSRGEMDSAQLEKLQGDVLPYDLKLSFDKKFMTRGLYPIHWGQPAQLHPYGIVSADEFTRPRYIGGLFSHYCSAHKRRKVEGRNVVLFELIDGFEIDTVESNSVVIVNSIEEMMESPLEVHPIAVPEHDSASLNAMTGRKQRIALLSMLELIGWQVIDAIENSTVYSLDGQTFVPVEFDFSAW